MNFTTLTDDTKKSSVYFHATAPLQNLDTISLTETPKLAPGGLFRAYRVSNVCIPLELFLETFQYLDTHGLLAARTTCRDWNKITDYVVRHKNFKSIYPSSPVLFEPFISSIERKHTEKAEFLLYYGNIDVNKWISSKKTPLHLAAKKNNLDLVTQLLEKGAIVDAQALMGLTPLVAATRYGCIEIMNILVSAGADLKTCIRWNGTTLLHVAAEYNRAAVVSRLIELGLNSSVKNNYGETPLHTAAFRGYIKIVNILLAAGADIDAKDKYGATALQGAMLFKHYRAAYALLQHQYIRDTSNAFKRYAQEAACSIQ